MCLDLFAELFKLNTQLSTGLLELLEIRFAKNIWILWSTMVLWILISELNVFGLIFRTIWEESRTVNRTLDTLRNEFSFGKYEFDWKMLWEFIVVLA